MTVDNILDMTIPVISQNPSMCQARRRMQMHAFIPSFLFRGFYTVTIGHE